MSRQNKVNPGMYTQRGRLTQDDAARELKRQRVIGSHHTWQPVQRDQKPVFTAEPAADDTAQDTESEQTVTEKKPEKKPAKAKAAKPVAKPAKAA
ncbi:MAG TPA: hypothetical protein VNT81_14605, partial [Vicinamibacterales bacterium]|nr:hypothetical protein [Vicinamibacterales bacterium]